jgi:hypothetical protein
MPLLFQFLYNDVIFAVALALLLAGGTLLPSDEFRQYKIARVCWWLLAVYLIGRVVMWSALTDYKPQGARVLIAFLLSGVVGVICSEMARAITAREENVRQESVQQDDDKKKPPTPSVQQESHGANSPVINVPGDNNRITVIAPPADNPPKKDTKTSDIAEASFLGGGFREGRSDDDIVRVAIGGYTAGQSRARMIKGQLLIPFGIGDGMPPPITVGMDKDGKLVLSCELIGGDKERPFQIEIHNNVFSVASGLVQKNYNDKALEVADDQGIPLFQVIQESPDKLRINGIFVLGQQQGETVVRVWAFGSKLILNPNRPEEFVLKPIFKYPSWKYLGQYSE